jgi:type II secretory pathway pseudopilin PulG
MKVLTRNKKQAFSLVEILLAITLFVAIILVIGTVIVDSFRAIKTNEYRDRAVFKLKEVGNAITVLKNDLWSSIIDNTNDGDKYLTFSNGRYSIADGIGSEGDINYSFQITDVYRDINGNISESGTYDAHTRKVIIAASWNDTLGEIQNEEIEYYVNDWNTTEWITTTLADFDQGTYDNTYGVDNRDGEVIMQSLFYPDWCKPTLQLHSYDIPGNAYAKSIFGLPGKAYLGTTGNASGTAFTDVSITGVDDPVVSIRGDWNYYVTNDIFVSGNYAYLATRHPNNEVVILNLATLPITQVGVFNAPGTKTAHSVYVQGNIGYVAVDRDVYTFDLTSKTGSRPLLGSIKVSLNANWGEDAIVSKIVVNGNYLYAALNEDWYELTIVDVSNPINMVITSQTSVNNQQTGDLRVRSDGNRVYFSTDSSLTEPEFFIIDTSTKTGARNIIGSYDTNGMDINGLSIIELDYRAILVGENGQEYQVLNISNESAPTSCGGMEFNNGIFDIDTVIDAQGNTFSYLVTNDPVNDFQIIRGGPGGGGGANGYGYAQAGTYTSKVYDVGSLNPYYYYMTFNSLLPTNTSIRLQARSSDSPDLSSLPFLGPDGTSGTYFTTNNVSFASIFQNKQYIQYRAYFTSDSISTPELELVRLNYQK